MIKDFFGGYAVFEVEGCDYLLLNRLRMYCVRNVSSDAEVNRLRFTVPLRFVPRVKLILARQKYTMKINKNFFGLVNTFYSRLTLSIAAAVCVTAFFILSGFIFSVKVMGVTGERAEKIAAFVHSQGMRPLMHKSGGQAAKVAGDIAGNFNFVAHASSKIIGNTLIFNVYAVVVPQDKNQGDIVAAADGIVTNIIVASGRAMVSVGDAVRTGQILIKGERQTGSIDVGVDEFGRLIQEGVYMPCRAVGEVMADVKFSEYGVNITADELLAKIIVRTGIKDFDKIEQFSAGPGMLEIVATVNMSIL